MKTIINCLLPLCFVLSAQAQQIRIMPGTSIRANQQLQLVLNNGMNFENNADLQAPTLQILASGAADNRISGTGMLTAGQLLINKTPGAKLILEKNISITGEVSFTEGFLDLNGHTLQLSPNALLKNEHAGSRITGNNGGAVEITTDLRAPSNENPGNLGIWISSAAEPGLTTIRRRQQAFNNGGGNSINRSYELVPANNNALNATVTMQYFDEELNGLNENILVLYQSPNNGVSWYARGSTNRDNSLNRVTAANIASLNTFTLSSINNPLPVRLSSISLSCNNDQPTLEWETANPQDVQYFIIEKSNNSLQWETVIGNIPPHSSPLHEYRYSDDLLPAAYYRIKSIEHNGEISYSSVLRADCRGRSNSIALLSNPVRGELQLTIVAQQPKLLGIQVIDPQGRILHNGNLSVNDGHSIRSVPLPATARGLLHIRIIENGNTVWTKTFLKM